MFTCFSCFDRHLGRVIYNCLLSRVSNKPISVLESGVLSSPSSSPYWVSLTKWATLESSSDWAWHAQLNFKSECLGFQTEPSKGSLVCWPLFKGNEDSGLEVVDKMWPNTTRFGVKLNDSEYFFPADTFILWSMEGLLTPRQGMMMQVSVCHWSK